MSYFYRWVLVRTYESVGEPSRNAIRAHVLPRQGLPEGMKVECGTKMRTSHPVGTIFRIWARLKFTEERDAPLYTSWQWKYFVLTEAQAKAFLKARRWGKTTDKDAR